MANDTLIDCMLRALSITPWALATAYALDLLIGDPDWFPHPVVIIGRMITLTENALRVALGGGIISGAVLTAMIAGGTFVFMTALVSVVGAQLPAWAVFGVTALLGSMALATHGLIASVAEMFRNLSSIEDARRAVSMIVGRDTAVLDEDGVLRAAIESLAENASDGIVAPLLYLAIGGVPLAFAYKAINTLDSMVGYRDSRYIEFGRASARLDDLVNYVPARLTGLLIVASATGVVGLAAGRASWRIMLRDGRNHTSPNSGLPEAAMAGALGVRLGGTSTYGGMAVVKPTIGDPRLPLTRTSLITGIRIVTVASALGASIILAIKGALP